MKKYRFWRRRIGGWNNTPPDYANVHNGEGIKHFYFDTIEEMYRFVEQNAPHLIFEDYPIRNDGHGAIVTWTVVGFYEETNPT